MPGKINKLGIELRVIPVGFENRRFQIVEIDGQGHPAKGAETIFGSIAKSVGDSV